ncbi:MAG: PAS domain S-box protein [Rhodospirillales bacterium]|nr:PAS domain S-box protein [Rhodospirillales bacterium]
MLAKLLPWKLFAALLLVGLGAISITTLILYNTTIDTEIDKLQALSQSHAKLIGSITQFDSKFNSEFPEGGSRGATLLQISNAHFEKIGFGDTGEFVIGRIKGDQIHFLIPSRNLARDIPPVGLNAKAAEPMRRALLGRSGAMNAPDYQGQEVLAWYEPLPGLDAGFVAKINTSEIRAPFERSAWIGSLLTFIISSLSCIIFSVIATWSSSRVDTLPIKDRKLGHRTVVVLALIGCITLVGVSSATSVVGLLYTPGIERHKNELLSLNKGMASLIESVAKFDAMTRGSNSISAAAKSTIFQVQQSSKTKPGFGDTGEIVLGKQDGIKIRFLLSSRFTGIPPPPVRTLGTKAEPMRRALSGKFGIIEDLDYRGKKVIAAYQPVKSLGIGIVTKMDFEEIRRPYVTTGAINATLTIFIVVLGILLAPKILGDMGQSTTGQYKIETTSSGTSDKYGSVHRYVPAFLMVLAGCVFLLDYMTPLGIAAGIPYIALLIIAAFFTGEKGILVLTLLATVLVFIGWAIAPSAGAIVWKVVTNRLYAVFTIWLAAIILVRNKKAEESTRKSETRLFTLIESAPDATLIVGTDGEIIFANQQAENLFGYSKSEFKEIPVEALVPKDIRHRHPDLRADFLGSTNTRPMGENMDLRAVNSLGKTFPVEVSLSPIETDEGKVVAASIRDITERKQAEQKLADAFNIISSSIDYASNIQRSVLPSDTLFTSLLSDHFVWWEPRDVVGGDIYWSRMWGDGFLIILGDCTGHGVPGAFMTLIATGALDKALTEVPNGNVADLMQRIHQIVQITVGQHGEIGESDDGLELGICYLDSEMNELTFVGARF